MDIKKTERSIYDAEYEEICQRIMKLNIGMDFYDFTCLLAFTCKSTVETIHPSPTDLAAIRPVVLLILQDDNLTTLLHHQGASLKTIISACDVPTQD